MEEIMQEFRQFSINIRVVRTTKITIETKI